MKRDWGHPPLPWYTRPERRAPSEHARGAWRSMWERTGSLYGPWALIAASDLADAARAPDVDASDLDLWDRGEPVAEEPTVADPHTSTLQEIADELGVSREMVRQIEANALRHLAPVIRALLHGNPRDLELAIGLARGARATRVRQEAIGARIRRTRERERDRQLLKRGAA